MDSSNYSECYPMVIETIKRLSGSNISSNPCPMIKQIMTQRYGYFTQSQKCPRPCEKREYQGMVKEYLGWGSERHIFFLTYFLSNEMNVQEEYLVYNEVDLIGIIGGNLGLFIGFSFHDMLRNIISFFIWYSLSDHDHEYHLHNFEIQLHLVVIDFFFKYLKESEKPYNKAHQNAVKIPLVQGK